MRKLPNDLVTGFLKNDKLPQCNESAVTTVTGQAIFTLMKMPEWPNEFTHSDR